MTTHNDEDFAGPHCGNDCRGRRYADGELADDPNPQECEHCPCCCTCLACEYGPRDGMPLTEAQRAGIGGATVSAVDHSPAS